MREAPLCIPGRGTPRKRSPNTLWGADYEWWSNDAEKVSVGVPFGRTFFLRCAETSVSLCRWAAGLGGTVFGWRASVEHPSQASDGRRARGAVVLFDSGRLPYRPGPDTTRKAGRSPWGRLFWQDSGGVVADSVLLLRYERLSAAPFSNAFLRPVLTRNGPVSPKLCVIIYPEQA